MGLPWLTEDPNYEVPVKVVVPETTKWLQKAQKELYKKSSEVIEDALSFRDLDPSLKEPPPEWIEKLGTAKAWRKFRVAMAGWMSAKEAPVGFKIAKDVFVGISKAMAVSDTGPKQLNMTAVQVNFGPAQEFPKVRIEKDR